MSGLTVGVLGKWLYSAFSSTPKVTNIHTDAVARLSQEIVQHKDAIATKTGKIYTSCFKQIKEQCELAKQTCYTKIAALNGKYYRDPTSSLKQSWEQAATSIVEATTIDVESHEFLSHGRELIPRVNAELDLQSYNPSTVALDTIKAKTHVAAYLDLEKERDGLVQQLHEIISIQKNNHADLYNEKLAIEGRLKELCGSYYGDTNGLLDRAWKAYQDNPVLEINFRLLEAERVEGNARLAAIQEELNTPIDPSVEIPNVSVELFQQKEVLQARLKELCGDYYGDSRSLLDKAWNSDRAQHAVLDEERLSIYARLGEIEECLRLPSHPNKSYDSLACAELSKKISQLMNDRDLYSSCATLNFITLK